MRHIFAVLLLVGLFYGGSVAAQDAPSEDQIIDVVLEQYPFGVAFADQSGWTARAFDAQTVYGIWRVQFWDAAGEVILTADVDPESGEVLAYEGQFYATPAQLNEGREVVYDFVAGNETIVDLVDDLDDYDTYIDYDAWNKWWGMWIENGYSSLYAIVRFGDGFPWTLDEPELLAIGFANVPDFDEWISLHQSDAIALAFSDAELASAVRPHTDWTASAFPVSGAENGLWTVEFSADGDVIARAQVDLDERTITILDG